MSNTNVSPERQIVDEFNDFYPDLMQFVNGMATKNYTTWSEWDESVRRRLIGLATVARRVTENTEALRSVTPAIGLEARCEEVANDLCTYVAMQGTTMELEGFMFRCADKLRGGV